MQGVGPETEHTGFRSLTTPRESSGWGLLIHMECTGWGGAYLIKPSHWSGLKIGLLSIKMSSSILIRSMFRDHFCNVRNIQISMVRQYLPFWKELNENIYIKIKMHSFIHWTNINWVLMSKELCCGVFKDAETRNDCKARFPLWGFLDTQISSHLSISSLNWKCLHHNRTHRLWKPQVWRKTQLREAKAGNEARYQEAQAPFQKVQFMQELNKVIKICHCLALPCTVLPSFSCTTWWCLVWLTSSSLLAVSAERPTVSLLISGYVSLHLIAP